MSNSVRDISKTCRLTQHSVDVIISNCVINLSPDKAKVFGEAFRVLKPGGKLAVSDIVTDGPLPEEIKKSLSAWAGCVAGAVEAEEYIGMMKSVGFTDISIVPVFFAKEDVDSALKDMENTIELQDDFALKMYIRQSTAQRSRPINLRKHRNDQRDGICLPSLLI